MQGPLRIARKFTKRQYRTQRMAAWVLAACAVACFGYEAGAQQPLDPVLTANQATAKKKPGKQKQSASAGPAPSMQIPVAALGFAPPAPFYLTERFSQASLSFLSEDKILFTFRVPGLIPREMPAPGQERPEPRHIRAVVLSLPSGKIEAEAMWDLYDYGPYLWPLANGKFLLRDRAMVQIGDASLHLNPFLRFPGEVKYLELDPDFRYLIANTFETPAQAKADTPPRTAAASMVASGGSTAGKGTSSGIGSDSGHVENTAKDNDSGGTPEAPAQANQNLVRILNMDTRAVLLFSRVSGLTHLAVDGEGYYEAMRGKGGWQIVYQSFHGGSTPLYAVDSQCHPALDVLTRNTVLASGCNSYGGRVLTMIDRGGHSDADSKAGDSTDAGRRLWEITTAPTRVWPEFTSAANGLRFARSTLDVNHPVGPSAPLDREDIRNQVVDVYDAATGKVALTVTASPVLDAGGNFALSPQGGRFAVLNQGAIQVFDLPKAPAMPAPAPAQVPAQIPGKP
jgi:hypothetical protein